MKYVDLRKRLFSLCEGNENFVIGKSLLKEEVLGFHVGDYRGKQILLTGGIHAREYISSLYLIEEIKFLSNQNFEGGFFVVPMLNPDGVRLVLDGAEFIEDKKLKKFLCDVNEGEDFSLWKANANCVDLNVNFDANWGSGKKNRKTLSSENFIGYYPNSEIENLNIIKFLKNTKLDATISFHSKGEVIYYKTSFERKLAKSLSKENRFKYIPSKSSTGGLSDYAREKFSLPSLTVELGQEKLIHPIREDKLVNIFEKNKNLPLIFLQELQ